MHATIYLAKKLGASNNDVVCLKVFKAYQDAEAKDSPENEYRVSSILRDHPNIVNI